MTHHWQHEHQYQLNSSSRSFAFSFVMLFSSPHPVAVVVFLFFGNLEIVDRACLALQSDITNVPQQQQQQQHRLVMSIFVAAFPLPPLPPPLCFSCSLTCHKPQVKNKKKTFSYIFRLSFCNNKTNNKCEETIYGKLKAFTKLKPLATATA